MFVSSENDNTVVLKTSRSRKISSNHVYILVRGSGLSKVTGSLLVECGQTNFHFSSLHENHVLQR